MSRIGRKPIPIPSGVDVAVDGDRVRVKGPKGALEVGLFAGVSAETSEGNLVLGRADDERQSRAAHGLVRALLANAVTGVSEGWSKDLDIIGIGYRAEKQGDAVVFNLVAADIRGLRPPEPYKGKGVRYSNERVRTKAGKQGAS